jgi:hypothetical protein
MGVLPAQARVTSETLDALEEFLRGRFSGRDDPARIEDQPTGIEPTLRDERLVRPWPDGDEGR